MNNYKVILFDLDGTLSDPKIGITKSVQYALNKMGTNETNLDNLEGFIGPPLQVSFAEYYVFNEPEIDKAIGFYRERFKQKGMFENELYPQITAMLKSLKDQGFKLVIATSKPTIFAKEIVNYFNIADYFELIVGSNLDGTRTSKTKIIQHILETYNQFDPVEFIMIGDREHDIIGARNTGIDSIGVTYGYGSFAEISQSNPTCIVETVGELKRVLMVGVV
ncbi:HAD family hydrolase [Gracilibacillus caseinilyticus]|uniref:HAD family hydrolase n=1 Tax=Gracilibacillus caseinilyticus TaxID=2932256 RepID=A0ABY4EWF4_9BACI|nr:HAD family hydrolase [Gracilibacillus caseinilyticus]UOQ48568.1 HAD family hydrolase [Gracilibacillus caseinilyticus]